jgi:hypothetical protein
MVFFSYPAAGKITGDKAANVKSVEIRTTNFDIH